MNCCSVYYVRLDVVKMTEDLQILVDEGKGFKKDDRRRTNLPS